MAFGEILRNARVQKGMTVNDVAEQTRMLVQIVENLEQEDFRRIAAPLYGRGFVKLYAELLELDPQPLVSDFMQLYSGARAPVMLSPKGAAQQEAIPESRVAGDGQAPTHTTRHGDEPPRPQIRSVAVAETSAEDRSVERGIATVGERKPGMSATPAVFAPRRRERSTKDLREPLPAAADPVRSNEDGAAREARPAEGGRKDFRPVLVVEPEEPSASENEEPDLFRAPRSRSRAAGAGEGLDARERAAPPRHKLPVFEVTGRLQSSTEPLQGTAARGGLKQFARKIRGGLALFRQGVLDHFRESRERRRFWLAGGAGAALLVLLAFAITLLFKATEQPKPVTDGAVQIESIAPPPPLYVD